MHADGGAAPSTGDSTTDLSSPYFIDAAHPYAVAAASALTSHRSKSKWSHLSSLPLPDPLPASALSAVLLLLRRRPHVALSFHSFALRRLLPSRSPPPLVFSASAAHVAAASRLRRAAISVLSSATCHYSPSQIFNTLAATYRRFASAPFVFDLLLLAYLRSRRDPLAATSIARRLLAAGACPLPSTSAALFRSLPSAESALEMYHQIYTLPGTRTSRALQPTAQTFNSLLLAFYRRGKCEDFNIALDEMDRYSCKHTVGTYNIRMAACCDCREMDKARRLWDEMVQGGIQPDVTTYNTMIAGYCAAGEVGMAEEMFKDMEIYGIEPSVTTFEWLVRGHCRTGNVDAAMLVRADLRRRGFAMAAEVVEEVVDRLCQKSRVKEGLGILRAEMKSEEFTPSRGSYEALIKGFCEEGEVEVALRLQAEMAGKGLKAGREVYHAFLRAYEKAENYDMVARLRKEMSGIGIGDEIGLDCMQ